MRKDLQMARKPGGSVLGWLVRAALYTVVAWCLFSYLLILLGGG